MVASLLAVTPASATPGAAVEQDLPADEFSAGVDEFSALAAARRTGQRVEVHSERTEYSQTFATPRGTFVVDEYVRPQWVRSTDGEWVDVDPSLRQGVDGSWRPAAATAEMEFSGGGGQAPLASISAAGVSVGLRWAEPLPAPEVDGNTATYRDVAPFVDLQVIADVDGFTHLLVIRSPKALDNPKVRQVELATELEGASLRVVESGAVEAVDGSGTVVFAGPSPMMWDSRDTVGGAYTGRNGEKGTAPPGVDRASALVDVQPAMEPVAVAVSAGKLTLTPDLAMLSDPDTVYPVFVDPTWIKVKRKRNKWSLLRKSFPSSSFYNPAVGSTSSTDATKGIVRAGYVVDDRTYTDRSIFNMSTSAVRYKRVNRATFSLTQSWSWYNCGYSSPPVTQLRKVGGFSSSTSWNSQPSWGSVLATSKKIRKYGYSCGPQRVEYSVTSHVRKAAASGRSSINLGLRAASESHGNWSRFRINAKLSMEYNTAPNAPKTLKVTGKACATGSSRPYVTVDRPTFSAKLSDPDSGQQSMTTRFYWWKASSSRSSSDYVTGTSANPGTANSSSIPSAKRLADRTVYKYQARTSDGIDVTWSSVCEFRTSLTPPDPPTTVGSGDYPEHDPDDPGPGSGGVGIPGDFTISPPSSGLGDVVGYAYTLDSGVSAAAAPTVAKGSGGSATVTLLPKRDGVNVLRVWTRDVASRFSTVREYRFKVRPGDGPAARWLFDNTADRGEDETGHNNPLTLHGGAGVAAGRGGVGEALSLNGSTGHARTAGPVTWPHPDTGDPVVVRTDSTFTVAAWARLESTGGPHQAVVTADGSRTAAFTLSYSGPDNRWRFAMAGSDADSTSLAKVFSDAAPVAGRWTHLAGSYDVATGQLRLHVNGVLQSGSATLSGGFHATGPVQLGKRLWQGAYQDYFHGQIDDGRVYGYLPPVSELVEAAKPLPPVVTFPDGDTATAGGTLRVRFDAAGDTNVTSFRYSAGTDTLDQTVSADAPGGTATVEIPVASAGELPVFAAAVDIVAHQSDSAVATATVVGDPQVSGVVYDVDTREPVAGATVMLDQAGLEVTSGADGSYSFDGFEAGVYTLAAHLGGQCGMATATELEITAPELVELWLTPARDSFGYECLEAPGTPFVPVGGPAIGLTGDDEVAEVGLPFAFPFYGDPHSTAWVDTNGVVSFADPGGSHPYDGRNLPAAAGPSALVAAYWDDLVVDGAASVHTETAGAAPKRTFTVEWRNVHLKGDPAARLSVQATLTEDGHLLLSYAGLDTAAERGQGAVVGMESPGGQVGVQYAYKQSALATDSMIVFVYPPEPNPITTATLSGTVVDTATGQPAPEVAVQLHPAELSVTTGPDGAFAFPELEWGSYLVEAQTGSHCGKTGQEQVELDNTTQIQLDLQPTTDEYGYSCQAGPRGFEPVSTQLGLSGDDNNQSVNLPFPVSFYGETRTVMWVNTNGLLIFAPQGFPWWAPHEIPSVHHSPSAAIYPFWSDWFVDASASVWTGTNGTAPDRRFVVEWRNVRHVEDSSVRVSFQVVLEESTGRIAVAWSGVGADPIARGSMGVVGIENVDGTIALPYAVFEQAITSGQGVVFTPGDPGLHLVTGEVTCGGSPAAGVEVTLADQSAVTDGAGEYTFTGVPPGPNGLVASAGSGPCAGAVAVPVTAVRGEPQHVDVGLTEVAQAPGYTVAVAATSMLAAPTVVPLTGDDAYAQVTPPFPVQLYGQTYGEAWVDTNGYLMFADRGYPDPLPFPIPSVEWSPHAAVYPFWNDWVVDSQASVRTGVHGAAPDRQWVVEWRDVHPYNMWQRVRFQVVFHEATGQITFSYGAIGATFVERGGVGLAGVENADGTVAAQFSYLAPVLRAGRGLVLTPTQP